MIPWGTRGNLTEEEFYNRIIELDNIKSLLETTANGNAPQILLTGLRGTGKTVFLKRVKAELESNYLVIYMDFSNSECYQKNTMSVIGLLEFFLKELIIEAENRNLNTPYKKIEEYFKSDDLKIKDLIKRDPFQLPIFGDETNVEELMNFVLTLPEEIYYENKNKIDGVLIFVDEFQTIKELNDYEESFLWKIRSYIQNQRNVSYTFSGTMSMQDELIAEIAEGAFGGRMITVNLSAFTKQTVNDYLTEKSPDLKFSEEGFNSFYKCTSGIPAYVNIFATLLPKNIELTEDLVKSEFEDKIAVINMHLIVLWNKLNLREQNIIITLLDSPLKRNEIAKTLNVTTGSISKPLVRLQNQELIIFENNLYHIKDPILKRWLELEFENKGTYPFRMD